MGQGDCDYAWVDRLAFGSSTDLLVIEASQKERLHNESDEQTNC